MNPALWGCPWSEIDFTWLGGSLWIQGQGPVELQHFPLQQQPLLCWARILCQQPCPGTATLRAPTTAHLGWGKHPLGKQELADIPLPPPCSYQPTLIFIAKLGARPLGSSPGQCCDTGQSK